MIRNRYAAAPYIADGTEGRKGTPKHSGKWGIIAGEMGPRSAVTVDTLNEAKMLQRACAKRGLCASVRARKGELIQVVVP